MRRILLVVFSIHLAFLMQAQDELSSPEAVIISYTSVNKTLPQVLNDLVSISGVNIIYAENKLSKKRKVKIQARDQKLGVVLRNILLPFRLDYEIIGENIVIISKRSEDYQKQIILSGIIRDQKTKEPLPYCNIFDQDGLVAATSNENGFYSLTIPRKEYNIEFSYIGYKSAVVKKFLGEDQRINIELNADNTLNQILVTDQSYQEDSRDLGKDRFDKSTIGHATFLGGEADIYRVMGMSAGVSTGADGFGGLNVRGGSYDQNLILYDGAPLHHTGHALGLVSIFNSATIQEATLYKSNYPTKYGGKLSSILDIRTRDGNYEKFSGEIGLSALASRVSLEGPLSKGNASFLVSYRRTYSDVWIKALSRYQNDINGDEGEASYGFQDMNAKLNFKLGANYKLGFTYYRGNDNFDNFIDSEKTVEASVFSDKRRNKVQWGSELLSFQLHGVLSKKLFSRLIGYSSQWSFSNYNFSSYFIDRDTSSAEIYNADLEESKVGILGARLEFDYLASKIYTIKTGLVFNKQKFSPLSEYQNNIKDGTIYPVILSDDDLRALTKTVTHYNEEFSYYLQNDFRLGKSGNLSLGIHSSLLHASGERYLSLQPRAALSFDAKNASFKLSYSQMAQYNQVLSDNQLGFPSDLWVTTTDLLKPATSWQTAAGITFNVGGTFNIGTEVYYREMNNIISLAEGGVVPFDAENLNWENSVPRGLGSAYGVETTLQKRFGRFNFNLNYTYSKSTRDFEDLNNGIEFDFRYDRTHMLNCNMRRALGEFADVSINFVYGTGNPVTIPTSEIVELTNVEGEKFLSIVYTEKNNVRIKDYLRVDLGFNFYTKYKFGYQKFFIGVYNMTNNLNPLYFDIKRNKFDPNVYELNSISVLPILPAINYSLAF